MDPSSLCDTCETRGSCFKRCADICQSLPSSISKSPPEAIIGESKSTPYIYEPLVGPAMIRLLRVFPSEKGGIIDCTVHTVSLDSKPLYVAVSYTWGDSVLSHTVRCNGQLVKVTANLWSALQTVKYTDEPDLIWVDRLCINQEDLVERSHQVQLMHRIYREAEHVLVCLGEPYGDERLALDLMARIDDLVKDVPQGPPTTHEDPRSYGLPPWGSPPWQAIQRMICRSWFSRSWIIQEYSLATEVIGLCGLCVFDPRVFCNLDFNLHMLGLSRSQGFSFLEAVTDAELIQAWRSILALGVMRSVIEKKGNWSLQNILSRHVVPGASDPRDLIYSLIGLLEESEAAKLVPDYTLSTEAVFARVCKHMLDQGSLEFLYEAGCPRKNFNLPSWVPDWTVLRLDPTIGRPVSSNKKPNYCASGNSCCVALMTHDAEILEIEGSLVDVISYTGCVPWIPDQGSSSGAADAEQLDFAGWLRESLEMTSEILSSGHNTSTSEDQQDTLLASTHMRTLLMDNLYDAHRHPKDEQPDGMFSLDDYHAFMDVLYNDPKGFQHKDNDRNFWKAMHESSDDTFRTYEFQRAVTRQCYSRRFCATDGGRIGQIPYWAEDKDEIWVFPGLQVPVVLRKDSGLRYRLVGEAYIHGIMFGEISDTLIGKLKRIQLL
jgi:hypothetical protein